MSTRLKIHKAALSYNSFVNFVFSDDVCKGAAIVLAT